MITKEYKRGELLDIVVNGRQYSVFAIQGKRVVTKYGKFRFAEVDGWALPWGNVFQPNLHMVLPLCNRGSQRIW